MDRGASELAELARCARAGDASAFRGWLEATHPTVYRVALRMLGDAQEADDVAQETFTRAWQSMAQLKEPGASLGWICRITRNVATDHMRRSSRREIAVLDRPGVGDAPSLLERLRSTEPGPENALRGKEERARVHQAVQGLASTYRTALLLRDVDGLSYEEIATVLGVPRGTVESRIHRARGQVKKSIERAERRESRRLG
ncbi:MAG: sigma-70 family RNA polymerase sigma factor [Pseudomonadota bacterium]